MRTSTRKKKSLCIFYRRLEYRFKYEKLVIQEMRGSYRSLHSLHESRLVLQNAIAVSLSSVLENPCNPSFVKAIETVNQNPGTFILLNTKK